MDAGFALGLIAGEATFVLQRNQSSGKHYCRPRFGVTLHKRDTETLSGLQEFFDGVGNVYTSRENSDQYVVSSKEELKVVINKIIEHEGVDGWKQSEKSDNFYVWKQIVETYVKDTSPDRKIQMAQLAKNLNRGAGHRDIDWDSFIEQIVRQELA